MQSESEGNAFPGEEIIGMICKRLMASWTSRSLMSISVKANGGLLSHLFVSLTNDVNGGGDVSLTLQAEQNSATF